MVEMTADGLVKLAFTKPIKVPEGALDWINEKVKGQKAPIQVIMTKDESNDEIEDPQSPISVNMESWQA